MSLFNTASCLENLHGHRAVGFLDVSAGRYRRPLLSFPGTSYRVSLVLSLPAGEAVSRGAWKGSVSLASFCLLSCSQDNLRRGYWSSGYGSFSVIPTKFVSRCAFGSVADSPVPSGSPLPVRCAQATASTVWVQPFFLVQLRSVQYLQERTTQVASRWAGPPPASPFSSMYFLECIAVIYVLLVLVSLAPSGFAFLVVCCGLRQSFQVSCGGFIADCRGFLG